MVEVANDMVNIPIMKDGRFSTKDYAITFVYGMGKTQRERFKKMLEQGIECGISVADSYGVNYQDFITEVKKILNVED